MMIPTLYYFVGLPASGKSTYIKNMSYAEKINIHSSDTLREELLGDINNQDKNADIFTELHKRIKSDLRNGISVVYDATNLKKKNRIAFLNELKNICCYKKCICIMTPYEDCLKFNSERERKVPEDVIKRMYKNYQPPHVYEGFNQIIYHFNFSKESAEFPYSLQTLFEGDCGINNFDQQNKHHTATLGVHCKEAYQYIVNNYPYDKELAIAALLHDIGKIFTKSPYNGKREKDGDYHYFNHNCVGSYDSMFYLNKLGLSAYEMMDISNLIYYHMHPYLSWEQSEKAYKRDVEIMGADFIERVKILHKSDLQAH